MILIVDDNQQNIFSLKALLTLHNFEVDTALSGEEALKKILKKTYSLIILDVQMPEMDGFEVAEAISGYSKSKDIPIIFLSAVNTHKKFVTKGYTSGGIDYLTKPFDPDIMMLKVKTFYKLSEQTRQLRDLEKQLRGEIELRKNAESLLEKKVQERTRQLLSANKRLEQSNRELQQFAFVASHDLQEPLRKIQTFSNIALQKHLSDTERLKADLTRICDSAGRLRTLIHDLLDYSKIFAEDVFLPVDLNQIVEEVLYDLEIHNNGKQCDIDVSPLPQIEAISFQVRQVFQNLISNAVKFARPDAKCIVKITGELVAEKSFEAPPSSSGKYCRILVQDNGIGFSNNFRHQIFDIFQRLNDRSSYEGTGIGLSIVKKVVERHDGLITASGVENEGATFTIVLPIKHNIASA
jgi:signal transduction histidine kinase